MFGLTLSTLTLLHSPSSLIVGFVWKVCMYLVDFVLFYCRVPGALRRIQAERRQRALLAQRLRLVDELVAAVVARVRVALGVLVRHHAAERVEHRHRREVLRRDQAERRALPLLLVLDDVEELRVRVRQALVHLSCPLASSVSGVVRRHPMTMALTSRAASEMARVAARACPTVRYRGTTHVEAKRRAESIVVLR